MKILLTEKDIKDLLDGFTVYKLNKGEEIRIQIERVNEKVILSYEDL